MAAAMNTSRGTTCCPFTVDRRVVEQPQLADRPHDGHVPRIAQRLVLHASHLALVGERHRADAARRCGTPRACPTGCGKRHRLELAESASTCAALAAAQHPGGRGVVVERALEGIHDLVVERRLGLLRQPARRRSCTFSAWSSRRMPSAARMLTMPGREAAVGDHRDAPWPRPRRAASSARRRSRCCRRDRRSGSRPRRRSPGHRRVEVVGQGAHDRVCPRMRRGDRGRSFTSSLTA